MMSDMLISENEIRELRIGYDPTRHKGISSGRITTKDGRIIEFSDCSKKDDVTYIIHDPYRVSIIRGWPA